MFKTLIDFTKNQTNNVLGSYGKRAAYKELHQLKSLLNDNIITQEEFDTKSHELKLKIL